MRTMLLLYRVVCRKSVKSVLVILVTVAVWKNASTKGGHEVSLFAADVESCASDGGRQLFADKSGRGNCLHPWISTNHNSGRVLSPYNRTNPASLMTLNVEVHG